jgi:hypothetical protein
MLEVLAGVAPSAPVEFDELVRAVLAQRPRLSSCIVVLLAWDAARREFIASLRGSGLEVRALLVSEERNSEKGVLILHPGEIEAGLAKLR